mgnify:CR=1 FL=1
MIKIFIGTSANGEDSEAELTYEYSLRKYASEPLEIVWMRQSKDTASPFNGWNTASWATPFSGFRWAIPEICNFEGRAIYTDVDVLCLSNISELFHIDMNGRAMLARDYNGMVETSVILFDCKAMKDKIPSIDKLKKMTRINSELRNTLPAFSGKLDPKWNCLDGEHYPIEQIKLLHYTKMASQPWKPKWYQGAAEPHPRSEIARLWHQYHDEAISAGCKAPDGYEYFGPYNIIGKA